MRAPGVIDSLHGARRSRDVPRDESERTSRSGSRAQRGVLGMAGRAGPSNRGAEVGGLAARARTQQCCAARGASAPCSGVRSGSTVMAQRPDQVFVRAVGGHGRGASRRGPDRWLRGRNLGRPARNVRYRSPGRGGRRTIGARLRRTRAPWVRRGRCLQVRLARQGARHDLWSRCRCSAVAGRYPATSSSLRPTYSDPPSLAVGPCSYRVSLEMCESCPLPI